ncbi:unnamed protein product [Medioppia subpectinata]|uniref:proteasome endopeptidase complex n=1 Tax=Medioppia subpectinata TaxID=1979941 RepID=A0A7R9KAR5_9ACAR|nr:unnamed protein product [Medioppia subpectinata]CAG2099936.1 unnamed protein product [Medioppia subpectinata]
MKIDPLVEIRRFDDYNAFRDYGMKKKQNRSEEINDNDAKEIKFVRMSQLPELIKTDEKDFDEVTKRIGDEDRTKTVVEAIERLRSFERQQAVKITSNQENLIKSTKNFVKKLDKAVKKMEKAARKLEESSYIKKEDNNTARDINEGTIKKNNETPEIKNKQSTTNGVDKLDKEIKTMKASKKLLKEIEAAGLKDISHINEDKVESSKLLTEGTEGIILAADSRTSSGAYIPSRVTDKINAISDTIYCCRSGSAADTQIIIRNIKRKINKLALSENTKPSVKKTATLTSSIIYNNKEHMLAGYDTEFQIYRISPDGSVYSGDIILGGSGSGFIYGYSDAHYRNDMTLSEAVEFAKCMIRLAINRDAASGGQDKQR